MLVFFGCVRLWHYVELISFSKLMRWSYVWVSLSVVWSKRWWCVIFQSSLSSCTIFNHFPLSTDSLVFDISYSSTLRWVKRLAMLLGCGDLGLTTHTFRRSGASELARQGVHLPDILLYGRWRTERSAREYIRQGEVGILRARQNLNPQLKERIYRWVCLNQQVWSIYDQLFSQKTLAVSVDRLIEARFHAFERAIFSTFQCEGWVGRAFGSALAFRFHRQWSPRNPVSFWCW